MRLSSLAFAGYRTFAARNPAFLTRPLERIDLARLTILLGKNNSGKSTVARLLHHVLLALGSDGKNPFPMADGELYGRTFRDVQHNNDFYNALDLEVALASDEGAESSVVAQLLPVSDSSADGPPVIHSFLFGGTPYSGDTTPFKGLLPDVSESISWRDGARRLRDASCHVGPLREAVRAQYNAARAASDQLFPRTNEAIAQMLLDDVELRTAVSDWMVEHLEGWRVDVQRTLDTFKLMARRPGRESNLAFAGQGIQQVLPVVVLCCWRRLGRDRATFIDLIEQPELHLHDAAHAPLGDLLLSSVAGGNGNVVVETHSESLVLRVRRRVAEGLSPDNVAIYYVEDAGEGSHIRRVPVRPDGEVDWWPEGVFSESFEEVKAIRRAQRTRRSG